MYRHLVRRTGSVFSEVPTWEPNIDMDWFAVSYMKSRFRKMQEEGFTRFNACTGTECYEYWLDVARKNPEGEIQIKRVETQQEFAPHELMWIGEAYETFRFVYKYPSAEIVDKLSFEWMRKAFPTGHLLDLIDFAKRCGWIFDS
jgi:hypothetical protein